MAKKEFGGGLDALFNRTDKTQEQASTDEAPKSKAPEFVKEPTTPEDENDLINSVEDEQLREALRKKRMDGRGRPRTKRDATGKRTDGYSRTSLILKDEKVAKIKEIAFRETLTMKEIFELALDIIIEKYERKHGEVVPRPERYKRDINKVFN